MEIAVLIGKDGKTASFNEEGIIKVYAKENKQWTIKKEIPFDISNLATHKDINESIIKMVEVLGDCRIFVAMEIKGAAFAILENMNFDIWKVYSTPKEFLDYIYEKEYKIQANKPILQEVPKPSKINNSNNYFINLKSVMEGNERVTSKQVLLPFFHDNEFESLEIVCTHVPPWFDKEFEKLGLRIEVEEKNINEFKVMVCPNDKK